MGRKKIINEMMFDELLKPIKKASKKLKEKSDSDSDAGSNASSTNNDITEKKKRKSKKALLTDSSEKKEITFTLNTNAIVKHERSKNTMLPWIEKYRPANINNIMIDPILRMKLDNLIESNNIPNLLISGPSGTGKTTTIRCLSKQILGNTYPVALLELNASDNRGLDMINEVVSFCDKKISSYLHIDDIVTNKITKIIIFDEADNITTKAQNALANMMDKYRNTTRFCFTCNDSKEIINSIQSRCTPLHYKAINQVLISDKLMQICKTENVQYDEGGIQSLIFIAQGDLRRAINNMEAIYKSFNMISEQNVYKLCHQPHPSQIICLIQCCASKNIKDAITNYNLLKEKGFCNSDILQTLITVLKSVTMDETLRINYIKIISDTYILINEGLDTNLQMHACFARLINFV